MASTYLETQSTTIKNILVAPWGRERDHEIDAPNSENLNLKNIIERHLISHCQVSTSLTTITCRNIRIDIFEKGHPIEPGLENLRGGLVNTNMTPIRWIKATRYNRMNLLLGDTSLNNAVAISLVQTRGNRALLGRRIIFFLINFIEVQVWGHKFHKSSNWPNKRTKGVLGMAKARKCLSRKEPSMHRVHAPFCAWSMGDWERWLAITFPLPFLSWISSVNSWRRNTLQINLGWASFALSS